MDHRNDENDHKETAFFVENLIPKEDNPGQEAKKSGYKKRIRELAAIDLVVGKQECRKPKQQRNRTKPIYRHKYRFPSFSNDRRHYLADTALEFAIVGDRGADGDVGGVDG